MKYKLSFITILLLSIFITGCNNIGVQGGDMISSPKNGKIPIKGTWKITKYKIVNDKIANKTSLDNMIGKEAKFGQNIAFFHEEVVPNPQYKMRKSTSSYYFVYFYKINPKNLGVDMDLMDIITIYSSDKLFYEFIRIDDTTGLMYMEGAFLYLTKTSDEEPKNKDLGFNAKVNKNLQVQKTSSGVLIGLKKERETASSKKHQLDYRTLWISSENNNFDYIYEMPNLVIPRGRGFWNAEVKKNTENNLIKESIVANPIFDDNSAPNNQDSEQNTKTIENKNIFVNENNRIINVMFVGSDYVTAEIIDYSEGNPNIPHIRVIPLDNVTLEEGIKISDIIGQAGKISMDQSAAAALTSANRELREVLEENPKENSFTVSRRNGHWILKGRINSLSPEYSDKYLDYDINMIPPSKLVNYDNLYVTWSKVKDIVPEAIDAYTSPNQDFALIFLDSEILVYKISKGELSESPVRSINIDPKEKVVMAQWTKGDETQKWYKVVKEIGKIVN